MPEFAVLDQMTFASRSSAFNRLEKTPKGTKGAVCGSRLVLGGFKACSQIWG